MLAARQGKVRRHQRSKGAEGVIERIGNQRMRANNRRRSGRIRVHWLGVLPGIKRLFTFNGFAQLFVSLSEGDGSNPGHVGAHSSFRGVPRFVERYTLGRSRRITRSY